MAKTIEYVEGFLFPEYSKRKLQCLSGTYEELSRLYRDIPRLDKACENRREYLYEKQLIESKLVFARHLHEISGAVNDVAETVMYVSLPTEHKRKTLLRYLKKQGIQVKEMVFIEQGGAKRKISIVARTYGKIQAGKSCTAEELAHLLSVFYDKRLVPCADSALVMSRSFATFLFEDEPPFTLMSAMSRAVKENERISGDNYSVEEYAQGELVLMIADGMGSGEQASKDSESVIEFFEKFLDAGFGAEKAFTMVNAAIASQNQCTNLTTLDLCRINLHTAEAEFIKAGAVSSFLKRGYLIQEITCDSLPLGSFTEISPMTQSVQLMDGDMLIMMSDGVLDCFESENGYNRMKDVLARYDTANPKELSDYLLQYAINCQGGRIKDDMTILTAGLWESTVGRQE